jgi:alpha-L-fucosidase 2
MPKNDSLGYVKMPEQWSEGFPLGNGRIGVMCWGNGGNLRFSLDHHEAWDLRWDGQISDYANLTYKKLLDLADVGDWKAISSSVQSRPAKISPGPTKIHLGRFDFDIGSDTCSEFKLTLADAEVTAQLGESRMTAFVGHEEDSFLLRIAPWPKDACLVYRPFYETSPGLKALGYPEIEVLERNGWSIVVQHVLPDKFFAIAWNPVGPFVAVSVAMANDRDAAIAEVLRKCPKKNFNALRNSHKKHWDDFWSKSSVALPDAESEFLWRFGLYLLASSARKGALPPGLQGLWAMNGLVPPWHGDYHTNMNIQQHFSPAAITGHPDLLDCWLDSELKMLPKVQAFTKVIFGTDGAFKFCVYLPEYTPLGGACWTPVNFAWSNTGWLAMLAWERWRYSMDKTWLEKIGYTLVESAFVFYAANLKEGDDGKFHVPLSNSPEYEEGNSSAWCRDPNVDLALIRKCCDWIVEMESALGMERHAVKAAEIRRKLVEYHLLDFESNVDYVKGTAPQGKKVLGLWKDKLLDQPHRHPSHLMAIYPAMDITVDGSDAEQEIIAASVFQYLSLGQYCWAGHTYVEMASFMAMIGDGRMAHDFLCAFKDRWIRPNGLHFNREVGKFGHSNFVLGRCGTPKGELDTHGQLTINESCAFTRALCDMLLQSWDGKIRIFPAVPKRWDDAMFADLVAEGNFQVSAVRRAGKIIWVRIISCADGECRLKNPFGTIQYRIIGMKPTHDGELLVFPMRKGERVELCVPSFANIDLALQAKEIRKMQNGALVLL